MTGQSGIRKVKIETGEVLQAKPLDAQYFGEGITEWKGSIIQLTWQHGNRLRLRLEHVRADADVHTTRARAGA